MWLFIYAERNDSKHISNVKHKNIIQFCINGIYVQIADDLLGLKFWRAHPSFYDTRLERKI